MRSTFMVAVLAAVSGALGVAVTDASRGFSMEADKEILEFLEAKRDYDIEDMTGLTSWSVLESLLNRRQTCRSGYGYCRSSGFCCPLADICCPAGCAPQGAECCGDNLTYCPAGNHCYRVEGLARDVCCTNSKCTAQVTGGTTVTVGSGGSGGSGATSPPVPTPTPTPTQIVVEYYYFTITWTYYVYYWYYSTEIEASVVTSSVTTTSESIRITASNPAAATSAFSSLSATYSPYTPAEATSLKPLAGSTSHVAIETTPTSSVPSFSTPALGSTVLTSEIEISSTPTSGSLPSFTTPTSEPTGPGSSATPFVASEAGMVRAGFIGGHSAAAFLIAISVAVAIAMIVL